MARRSAAAKVVQAPEPELTIEQKRANREALAMEDLHDMLRDAQAKNIRFQEKLAKDGIAYALSWNGEQAMRDDELGRAVWQILRVIEAHSADPREDVIEILKARQREIARELLGDTAYVTSAGPWAARSTSPLHNIYESAKCDVARQVHALLERTIRKLSFAWGLTDEEKL